MYLYIYVIYINIYIYIYIYKYIQTTNKTNTSKQLLVSTTNSCLLTSKQLIDAYLC